MFSHLFIWLMRWEQQNLLFLCIPLIGKWLHTIQWKLSRLKYILILTLLHRSFAAEPLSSEFCVFPDLKLKPIFRHLVYSSCYWVLAWGIYMQSTPWQFALKCNLLWTSIILLVPFYLWRISTKIIQVFNTLSLHCLVNEYYSLICISIHVHQYIWSFNFVIFSVFLLLLCLGTIYILRTLFSGLSRKIGSLGHGSKQTLRRGTQTLPQVSSHANVHPIAATD